MIEENGTKKRVSRLLVQFENQIKELEEWKGNIFDKNHPTPVSILTHRKG